MTAQPERFGFAYMVGFFSMVIIVVSTLIGLSTLFRGILDPLYYGNSPWFMLAFGGLVLMPLPLVAMGWGYVCRAVWDAWNVRWGSGAGPA